MMNNNAQAGMAFMNQMMNMQRGRGGQPQQALIPRLMNGNPGGLLQAIFGNSPVNPGAPAPVGDPAYFPGGEGPMAGGGAPMNGLGLLAGLFK